MDEKFEKNAESNQGNINSGTAAAHDLQQAGQAQNANESQVADKAQEDNKIQQAAEAQNDNAISNEIQGSVEIQEHSQMQNGNGGQDANKVQNTSGEQNVNGAQSTGEVRQNNFTGQNADTGLTERNSVNLNRSENRLNSFFMNDRGDVRTDRSGAAVFADTRALVVLGWICVALNFLISPLFAIPGVIFGVMVNREARGRGNAIVVTNIVLAVLGMVLGFFFNMVQY